MVLTESLSTLAAFLDMLVTVVLLIPADYALQSVVGSDCALAGGAGDVLLFAAADLPTGFAGPTMLLAD